METNKTEIHKTDKTILIVFDMDCSLLNTCSWEKCYSLLNEDNLNEIKLLYKNTDDFAFILMEIFKRLQNQGLTLNELKNQIEQLELGKNFMILFDFIRENKKNINVAIITHSIDLFVEWILKRNGIDKLVDAVYANKIEIQGNSVTHVYRGKEHKCKFCNKCLCKQDALLDFIGDQREQYSSILFICDGEYDYCASNIFKSNDLLLPRENYALSNLLKKQSIVSDYQIIEWTEGLTILNELNLRLK